MHKGLARSMRLGVPGVVPLDSSSLRPLPGE